MNKILKKILFISSILTFFVFGIAIVKSIYDERLVGVGFANIEPFRIVGTGRLYKSPDPGSLEKTFPALNVFLLSENNFRAEVPKYGYYTMVIRGHFNKNIPQNTRMLFRLDNIVMRMSINNKIVYESNMNKVTPPWIKSVGSVWDTFISPGIDVTDFITIELSNIYSNNPNYSFYLLTSSIYPAEIDFVLNPETKADIKNSIFSFLIMTLGLLLIILYIAILFAKMNLPQLGVFGLFLLFVGIWFSVEYEFITFLIPYNMFLRLLDMVGMLFVSSLFTSYCRLYLRSFWRSVLSYLIIIDNIIISIVILLQFIGKYDFHELGFILLICATYKIVFILVACIYERIKGENPDIKYLLHSFIPVGIGSIVSTLGYTYFNNILILKIGFGFFLIFQMKIIIDSLHRLIEQNAELKYLKSMIFRDALTYVGNRNGYENKIEELDQIITSDIPNIEKIEKLPYAGLALFDINNLKKVNDTFGHDCGDTLIKNAVHIICNTFERSPVFRIGGDEFVAFLLLEDAKNISIMQEKFFEAMKSFNDRNKNEIDVSVSVGFTFYNAETDICFDNIFCRADKLMYEMKQKMKTKPPQTGN